MNFEDSMRSIRRILCFWRAVSLAAWLWLLALPCAVAEDDAGSEEVRVQKFLSQHCTDCHGEFAQEAGLRLDQLAWDASDPKVLRTWVNVHDRVARGEMPPSDAYLPEKAAKTAFLDELSEQLFEADRKRQQTGGRTPLRRLNRLEYENTLRELLALPMLDVQQMLPPDDRAHGFDNVAAAQEFSYVQMSRYLDAAEAAIDRAMFLREKPEKHVQRMYFPEQGRFTKKGEERGETRLVDEYLVFLRQPNSAQAPWRFGSHEPYAAGRYKIRVRGRGATYDHGELKPPEQNQVASIYTREKRLLGTVDLPGEASVQEFETWLYTDDELEFFCATLDDRNSPGNPRNVNPYKGPAIAIEYVEVEGPIYDQWPRESYRRLFGDLPIEAWTEESGLRKPAMLTPITGRSPKRPHLIRGNYKGPPLMVVSENPLEDAERLLRRFMKAAYRGKVDEAEFQRCFAFASERIEQKWCFQDAMREAYKAALCSPDFLFFRETPGRLNDHALANRLAYFLWRSPPDEELRELAESGGLQADEVLHEQVERMLSDPRSERFVEDFTRQWLDLRKIHDTAPDRYLYPEYFCDNYLIESAVAETQAYFAELIREDLGAAAVIGSDFAMLNERLAQLYGIDGVRGCESRRVPLPTDSVRGGLLTQSSIMKVTANGLTTSPVLRGVWLLERLLGQHVPPPPPGAGSIDPDTRGATTIREQLAKHRQAESCASCHVHIDPPGFALENFDVMGKWRQRYRGFEAGEEVSMKVADRDVRYKLGAPADSSGQTPGGETFGDITDYRRLLGNREEEVARNLIERMLTFATGAGIHFADRKLVDEMMQKLKDDEYGIRSIIHEVVASHAFRCK